MIADLFAALVCASAVSDIGRRAGDYLSLYRESHGVELGDALIAATAVEHRARQSAARLDAPTFTPIPAR